MRKKRAAKRRQHSVDVDAVIAAMDRELEMSRKSFLTAVEANALLARKGLLKDYSWHRGRALREVLKAGRIPHAYKLSSGRVAQWVIPHSALRRPLDKTHAAYRSVSKPKS